MPEELNSSHQYDIVKIGSFKYEFITDQQIAYEAYFSTSQGYFPDHPEFDHHILSFTFGPVGIAGEARLLSKDDRFALSKQIDPRVKKTIQYLLADSLRSASVQGIIVICDTHKGRDKCRHRLFNLWFKEALNIVEFGVSKYDSDLAGLGIGSIFVKNDWEHHQAIKASFLSLSESEK
jgi:hypothetical protein